MSDVQVIGLSHVRAPVALRERLAVPASDAPAFLASLRRPPEVEEAVLLSTCNRVEAWMTGAPEAAARRALDLMAARGGMGAEALRPYVYDIRNGPAVEHLFKVASSLDSMVVGETQILAQVKEAYRVAREAGAVGRTFHMLFQKAFNVAKLVHTETRISEGRLSVASVGVELAERVFRDLKTRSVLVLGAGETGELTAQALRDHGAGRIAIANRGAERGGALSARLGARAASLDDLPAELREADILVACAAADRPIVSAETLAGAMWARGGRPMFVLDLGVPRNVAPEAETIPDLYVYNIDDLQAVVARNLAARRSRIELGVKIVGDEARAYLPVLLGKTP
jgi:glutamyl-tRNA reductase